MWEPAYDNRKVAAGLEDPVKCFHSKEEDGRCAPSKGRDMSD